MISVLEADSIQLQFANRMILSDIYIKCETGKITGLLGRNGQGKSCLLQILYGTLYCEKSVRINRVSIKEALNDPGLIVYLPQFNFIPGSLSVKRVFSDFRINFETFLEIFPEFESDYTKKIGNLSGGGRRLVELYIISKSNTKFALLDEPFTHLSPVQIEKAKTLLLSEKENKGFLITDHLFKQVLDICDNIYVLTNGKTHLTRNTEDIETLGYARF